MWFFPEKFSELYFTQSYCSYQYYDKGYNELRELLLVVLILTFSKFWFQLYIDSFCIFRLYFRKLGVPY